MEPVGDENAGDGAEGIGEPIEGIISRAAGAEGLLELIERGDGKQKRDGENDTDGAAGGGSFPEQQPCREQSGSTHEIAEVKDLIDMGDSGGALGDAFRI